MFDRRLIQFFDWGLLGLTLSLSAIGLVTLYSAAGVGGPPMESHLFKQVIWFIVGLCVMIFMFLFDYKLLDRWTYLIYPLSISLLVFVLMFGRVAGGSKRWLSLGPVSLQPSELSKIAVIIVLAHYFSKIVKSEGYNLRELIPPLIYTLIPFLLIVKQPDLGTAMLVFLIAASMMFFVKIERSSLIYSGIFGLIISIISWFFYLKPYQKQRILTFLKPDLDPLGTGYHIIQSKIAIGSGMISGKGLFKGSQNMLEYLPEQHTDFIFSVFAEEWGFAGSVFLITLFLMLIIWGLNIAHECKNPFGTILAVGMTAMIFWQVFINIGMVMGLMPVVGVPLPFVSYGGSSIVTTMMCIGLLMNISMRRFMIE